MVSILTRPEGRMRLLVIFCDRFNFLFQSSPAPKGGCDSPSLSGRLARRSFQSSPAPKGGCDVSPMIQVTSLHTVSILTRPEGRMRLADANPAVGANLFQSSPAPKGGCDFHLHCPCWGAMEFQSSPAPKGGCDQKMSDLKWCICCFNPHPPRRADATHHWHKA